LVVRIHRFLAVELAGGTRWFGRRKKTFTFVAKKNGFGYDQLLRLVDPLGRAC
jgi:hypothetical protein